MPVNRLHDVRPQPAAVPITKLHFRDVIRRLTQRQPAVGSKPNRDFAFRSDNQLQHDQQLSDFLARLK